MVAGIDTEGPGFDHILIAPEPGGVLKEGRASYDAITGRIVSGWRIEGQKLILDVAIPPNTTATIRVPSSDPADVREGTHAARKSPGLTFLRTEAKAAVFQAASGNYRFETAWK
jgi:alpha-L-rhamnosidase